jgi:four helix bundle protein
MKAKSFEDLLVWKQAHAHVLEIYRVTKGFPRDEIFGLTAQMRRAAVSIPANIAEGFKKRTPPEKIRLLNISQGSFEESRYYLILAVTWVALTLQRSGRDSKKYQECLKPIYAPSKQTTKFLADKAPRLRQRGPF